MGIGRKVVRRPSLLFNDKRIPLDEHNGASKIFMFISDDFKSCGFFEFRTVRISQTFARSIKFQPETFLSRSKGKILCGIGSPIIWD